MGVAENSTPRVELRGITKSFPGVRALENVDFRVAPGEVHALLGENGAGKSTLIKVMTGALSADSGEVSVDGQPVVIASPAEARRLGISTVYQEVNLIATLSVTKNLTLGRQPRRFGLISWRQANARARERLKRLNLEIDVEQPLGAYSIAVQQLAAIARALEDDTRVLVLDEPTASLDARETDLLFGILRDLKARGIAIVFITHFIDQVYAIAERISVLRNGRLVGTALTSELPRLDLIALMLGRELQTGLNRRVSRAQASGEPVLVVEALGRRRCIAPFDLSIRAGEVVGLAGLLGSGRTETAKLVFGALRPDSGKVKISGEAVAIRSPRQSILHGIGFCPEDRKAEGLVAELSVRENIVLMLQSKRGWLRQLSSEEQNRLAEAMIRALGIATPDAKKAVGQLSGGNQQKVILARSLVSSPRILILDEPTRGIDVGAHAEILGLIRRLCSEGLGLLVASSEIIGEDVTQENIIRTIAAD
jgi:galactofuranose transport system ATP-binding protein